MKFIKNFVICLVVIEIFFFFGGALLFDINTHYYGAGIAYAFIVSAVISVYEQQASKIEELENRIKALEQKEE